MAPLRSNSLTIASALATMCQGQTLIDSIPLPGNTLLWGIHVTTDTIFLGNDGNGRILFADHDGVISGELTTPYDFNHGLVRTGASYLIAEDYTTNGAGLHEIGPDGTTQNSWTFPEVIGGPSSGIGDLCIAGDAVWYTMYYPDFDVYPFAYAYKWIPGDPAPVDTVPLQGEQPYGIAVKGDTLFYVTDNLNGDQERLYAYDLANAQDIGWIGLPDTPIDNDQRPQGLDHEDGLLYLLANRQGGSSFAYQTIFIYSLDGADFIPSIEQVPVISVSPSPAIDLVRVQGVPAGTLLYIIDDDGRVIRAVRSSGPVWSLDVHDLAPGLYMLNATAPDGARTTGRLVVGR